MVLGITTDVASTINWERESIDAWRGTIDAHGSRVIS
jgi:hypothetical protein